MWGLDTKQVDVIEITKKVIAGVYSGVTTVELDQLAAEVRVPLCRQEMYADPPYPSYRLLPT